MHLTVPNDRSTYHTAYLITFMPSTQPFLVTPLITHKCSICCGQLKRKKKGKGYEHSFNKYLSDYKLKKYKCNNVNELVMVKIHVKRFSICQAVKKKTMEDWLIFGMGEGVENKAHSVDRSINFWCTYASIKNFSGNSILRNHSYLHNFKSG